jgi:hypothetical protein
MEAAMAPNPANNGPAPPIREADLACRWGRSVRTLQRWRHQRTGPAWLKIGGGVFYRMEDVVAFEAAVRKAGRK